MARLFGTDGIRGKANEYPITPEIALKVGKAVAQIYAKSNGTAKAVIGKDTRISGYMLETALTSGMLSMGMDVLEIGPLPTPAVAHLVRSMGADCGIMITASHNPSDDNGIKIFSSDGFKLPDEVEDEIEKIILGEVPEIKPAHVGKAYRIEDARGRYIEFAKSSIRNRSLKGIKAVLDCANGAAYYIAPRRTEPISTKTAEPRTPKRCAVLSANTMRTWASRWMGMPTALSSPMQTAMS